ncbi:MAG: hypothetical protein H0V45_10685 [Actinobacteria bacterium]|nr:hypothetical protein [Actinomycetota bacterium]
MLIGAAALHPSAAGIDRRAEVAHGNEWRRLAVFVAAVLSMPAFGWLELTVGAEVATPVVLLVVTLLAALVLTRAFMLLSESERLRRTLAAQNEDLRELDRLKDDFVTSVSHELRTSLTSIRGYLELVREGEAGDLTEEQDTFLGVVDRNAERLLRVGVGLLFVAQLDAGAVPLERGILDPAELARHAADSARPVAAERGIELSLELGRLPAALSGDQARLAQALDNLVSNALKFTPAGGTVELSAAGSNGSVVLTVTDSGPGISELDQQRLFRGSSALGRRATRRSPAPGSVLRSRRRSSRRTAARSTSRARSASAPSSGSPSPSPRDAPSPPRPRRRRRSRHPPARRLPAATARSRGGDRLRRTTGAHARPRATSRVGRARRQHARTDRL